MVVLLVVFECYMIAFTANVVFQVELKACPTEISDS